MYSDTNSLPLGNVVRNTPVSAKKNDHLDNNSINSRCTGNVTGRNSVCLVRLKNGKRKLLTVECVYYVWKRVC